MNRLWRLLLHLFGEDPPPRPTGHVPDRLHHRPIRRHGHDAEDAQDDAPDDGPAPAPTPHHGH